MYRLFFKRLLDITLASIALPFWVIVLIIIGPIIYFEDKGPIFYNSLRLGKNGKIFKMYKFRSMNMNAPDLRNADGSTFNSENDPRLTKIGKFLRKTSLDETPQFLNVLKGDMSIIGPRPDLPEALETYNHFEMEKSSIKPGITGYSQAYFRNMISAKDKFKNDVYYVKNLSITLDVQILLRTIYSVVLRKNIFISDEVTTVKEDSYTVRR